MGIPQETVGTTGYVDSLTTVEDDGDSGHLRATYDSDSDSASLAVVAVVATASQRSPIELDPLHSVIDTEALDSLFTGSPGEGAGRGSVSLRYEDFQITVFSDGAVEANPAETA